MRSQERLPDYQAMTVWCTSELPVNNDESAFNNGEAGPKGQRVLLRIGEMGPDAHSASVMHRTETLDYAVVLAGTCDMELDNGEMIRRLKAGAVGIQIRSTAVREGVRQDGGILVVGGPIKKKN